MIVTRIPKNIGNVLLMIARFFLTAHSILHQLFRSYVKNLRRKYDFWFSKVFELGFRMTICLLLQFWSTEVLSEIQDHVIEKCNFRTIQSWTKSSNSSNQFEFHFESGPKVHMASRDNLFHMLI